MSQTQLNQILAVEKGVKARSYGDLTQAHQTLAKMPLLVGVSRTYQPNDDDGERFPPESTRVQLRASDVLIDVQATLTRLFDVVLTKDVTNCVARADVIVDGQTLLADVPATYLLFLEKQLVDLFTFVTKLPVLDPAEEWTYDPNIDAQTTEPSQTAKTKKVPRVLVKYVATPQHPAQVDVWQEDVVVGYWTTVKFSGALPAATVRTYRDRVVKLAEAVKVARERANTTPVTDREAGAALFSYIFGS
jgi:hypothetical protein